MSDLSRFHQAQKYDYDIALQEIKNGRKESHWMWYIFPQIQGLGYSSTAQYYAISDMAEAKAYLKDNVLRCRLVEISQALLDLPANDAMEVFGVPDNMKLRSSMTLFSMAAPEISVFQKVLDKFFAGQPDRRTLEILETSEIS
ncbi:DUF1810 domain-containing protein [Catenibacillus scindens]|nr:DUF1810 domain-containing protein [Catenibacillus scindens]